MKRSKALRRQIFVLTSEEKKVVACIVGAFVLGLATMHYRAQHPRPATAAAKQQQTKAGRQTPKQTKTSTRVARTTPAPQPDDEGED